MTNILAPYNESKGIYNAYQSNEMLNSSIGFVIPVFTGMPKYATESPNILGSDYQTDNTRVYADVTGTLNIRSGPGTSYEILTSINKNTKMNRIKKGIQQGEQWDKVELENGMVGYAFQVYLKEVPKEENEESLPEKNEDKNEEEVIIIPPEEEEEEFEIEFEKGIKTNKNEISGVNLKNNTVEEIITLINTELSFEIQDKSDQLLEGADLIGTGTKLILKNTDGDIVYTYYFILYGDLNGDGLVNSLDVLSLQRHILETRMLEGLFLKSGNISKNGNLPTSLDILKIQKHILEVQEIEQ